MLIGLCKLSTTAGGACHGFDRSLTPPVRLTLRRETRPVFTAAMSSRSSCSFIETPLPASGHGSERDQAAVAPSSAVTLRGQSQPGSSIMDAERGHAVAV